MTAARLQCLGGQQHLKSKYGGGYTLELRVADGAGAAVQAAVPSLFPGAVLEAAHAGKLRYEVAMEGVTLARIFEVMEAQKAQLGVLDYLASQPSLESIFLSIAEKDITLARSRKQRSTSSSSSPRHNITPPLSGTRSPRHSQPGSPRPGSVAPAPDERVTL